MTKHYFNMIKHNFRLNNKLNEKLLTFGKSKNLGISETIRFILGSYFNKDKNQKQQLNISKQIDDMRLLHKNTVTH